MSLSKRVTELSSEKRRLLTLLLKEQSIGGALLPLTRVERSSNVLPCSFAQQRLWFLDHLEPGNLAYIVPGIFRFDGPLDLAAFNESVNGVIRRHEILRTSFTDIEGEPVQVIEQPERVAVPLIDLSGLTEKEREAEVERLTEEEAGRAFDLERAPLLRVTLLKLDEQEHIVLLTMHHIISDGWSMAVVLQEMAALYDAFSQGNGASLEELPIQYADYAVWQREHLQGEVLEEQLAYWKNQLQDAPPVLELPSDRPRPPIRSSRGACISFALSPEVTERLRTLSRREGTTMFMTLLAAFKVLLHRYSGQPRIVVGTSVAGRNRKELEGLIGFFVNSLVLHTELHGSSSFREVLARVKETALGAYAHQELPFERLVEEFQADRSLSYTPLFQVFFSLQNAPRASKEMTGLKTEALGEHSRAAKFDLSLDMMETADAIGGSIEYNTDLFEAETIKRMIGHYQTIVQSIVHDPGQLISRLPLLTGAETQQLVSKRAEPLIVPRYCLHELFEKQAAQRPNAVAVICDEQQLTYGELNERANRLAHYLRELSVGPDVLVGICVERSVEMIVGILAILKSGGAYVPLDPAYPDERLAFMLADSGAQILLTQSALASRFAATDVQVLNLDFEHEWPEREPDDNLLSFSSSETAAYMIYTSGSTGKPKGVVITHANVLHLFEATQPLYHLNEHDVWTLFHSYAFDFSVWELWGALLYGGQLVIVPYLTSRSPEAFWELLRAKQVTVLNQTPSAFRQLINNVSLSDRTSLRLVIFGGEALEPPILRPWFDSYGDEQPQLFNMYGITETTVHVTHQLVSTEFCAESSSVIGQPISSLQLYILDANMQMVPALCAGELYVGGGGLARGYHNRPELTAERFVPDPFGSFSGGRLYKTGDVARRLPNGQIEYLGRLDHQIKIRGFRIELGEIEAVLTEHPQVREAVVIAVENSEGEKRLAAYVISEVEVSIAELRRFVAERLPAHMVPAGFVHLNEFPLTKNGKLDRAALPEAETTQSTEQDYVAPRTPLEEILCGIWIELLSVARVGVHDNFFQLGGHSLLATRVLARVRDAFEVEVPLRSLFESPTIAAMAEQVELAITTNRGLVKPPIERVPRDGPLPVSYVVERRLWRDNWYKENSVPVRPQNIHVAIHWSGPLDFNALEESVNEIIRRHEILRINFDTVNGEPVQVISEQRTITIPLIDLRHHDLETRKAEAMRLATQEVKQRFDLTTDLLLRMTVLRADDDQYMIVFVADHIICDGWSLDVFFTEFTALYNAFTKREPSPLPELPFQYVDYSHWQRNWLQGEVLENILSYWKKQFAGHGVFPEFELPIARPRPETQNFAGAGQALFFSVELTNAIKSLSRRKGVTIFMMLLAGLKVLLHRHSGRESIGVISPTANRTSVKSEALIGWFAQTLVLRTDISGDPSFAQLLERVREVTLGAFTHQGLPLPYLMQELSPPRSPEAMKKAMPHVFFNLDNYLKGMPVKEGSEAPAVSGVRIRQVHIDTRSSEAGLGINIKEHASAFDVMINYETSCYDAETINELLEHFESLMEAAVANPELRLSQLPLLTRAERNARKRGDSVGPETIQAAHLRRR